MAQQSAEMEKRPYVYPGILRVIQRLLTAKNFYSYKIFIFPTTSSLNLVSTRGLYLLRVAYLLNMVSSV